MSDLFVILGNDQIASEYSGWNISGDAGSKVKAFKHAHVARGAAKTTTRAPGTKRIARYTLAEVRELDDKFDSERKG